MTWISFICLLALTSSAFGQYAYGSGNTMAPLPVPSTPILNRHILPKTVAPVAGYGSQSYGQQLPSPSFDNFKPKTQMFDTSSYQQIPPQQPLTLPVSLPKTLPDQSYGSVSQGGYGSPSMIPQLDKPTVVPVLTQADILCQGRKAEDVIPLEDKHKFVVCLDNGKGVEQECPSGLFYHPTSQRCERNLGPLEDVCLSQPCLNGGQCLTLGSSFQCQCAQGFEGIHCELDARICQTQQPCGSAPDARCQSFRAGAALSYICIFQNGLAYGLNPQQVIPSPCRDIEGPQALLVSKNGFIMCDINRLFIESCPGGTIWDDIEKACSWPDQQTFLPDAQTPTSGYGSQVNIPQEPVHSYGSQMKVPQQPIQSYGSQVNIPQEPVHSYGSQMKVPQQPIQSYGSQVNIPQEPVKSYDSQMKVPQQPIQSYGSQMKVPQQPVQSYGSQVTIPQEPVQSYGSQMKVPQQPVQSYGSQMKIPQQQPIQSYGSQMKVPQQPVHSYGSQITIPRKIQAILPKVLSQPTQSYGSQLGGSQEDKVIAPKELPSTPSATPYGAAQFSIPKQQAPLLPPQQSSGY